MEHPMFKLPAKPLWDFTSKQKAVVARGGRVRIDICDFVSGEPVMTRQEAAAQQQQSQAVSGEGWEGRGEAHTWLGGSDLITAG